ncbi:hypothetical protein Cadr_000029202 [Camelus dromedarius]|uniref:Uncharacterized protein n=1 Tax=Camelus dromedarius TaxID=9838 RepID=A0A5N4C6A7_CAMDR|nr:hypothetical protein Cadr_000029202 [Camelus dromedarius]
MQCAEGDSPRGPNGELRATPVFTLQEPGPGKGLRQCDFTSRVAPPPPRAG